MAQSSTQSLSFSVDRLLQKPSPKRKESSSSSSGESTPPHSPPFLFNNKPRTTAATSVMINATATGILPFTALTPLSSPVLATGAASPSSCSSAWTMGQPMAFNSSPASITSWSLGPKMITPWTFSPATVAAAFSHLHPAKTGRHGTEKITFPTVHTTGILHSSPSKSLRPPPIVIPHSSSAAMVSAKCNEKRCHSSEGAAMEDVTTDGDDGSDDSDLSSPLSSPDAITGDMTTSHQDRSTSTGLQVDGKKYKKKKRTTFSSSQLQQLEMRFNQQKYLTKMDRCRMAAGLGLTEKHIKTWYQNRRTKWKRECTDEMWSRERETAAANMYTQHLQLKSLSSAGANTIEPNSPSNTSTNM